MSADSRNGIVVSSSNAHLFLSIDHAYWKGRDLSHFMSQLWYRVSLGSVRWTSLPGWNLAMGERMKTGGAAKFVTRLNCIGCESANLVALYPDLFDGRPLQDLPSNDSGGKARFL